MLLKKNEQTSSWALKKMFFCTLFLTLIFTSCQKENTTQLDEKTTPQQEKIANAKQQLRQIIQEKRIVSRFDLVESDHKHNHERVTSSAQSRSKDSQTDLISQIANNHSFQHYRGIVEAAAINPDDFECDPTFLNDYIRSITQDFTADDFFFMNNYGNLAILEGLILDDATDLDYFGFNGDFTSTMRKTFINLRTFWDIPKDFEVADAHGSLFKNVDKTAEVFKLAFGGFDENGNFIPVPDEIAYQIAQLLNIVFSAPVFEDYNHPLFTFNAIAFGGFPPLGIPKKIVMGDGIMEAYAALGFRTNADRLILAHEFGHQIQFANGYFEGGPADPAEATRRTELMADAYAAYFLSHGKGPFLQPALISRFVKTSFSIGDCGFASPNHHGTPNQRAKAAAFGGELAKRRGFIDQIYSSQEFFELFEAALPEMIAPDAE